MLEKQALVLSPFATVPADAGQRKRVLQTTRILQDFGYEITFLLYAFEDGWKTRANEEWIDAMRDQWGEVIVWRANQKVGTPPVRGYLHGIDEWWDSVLETQIKEIFTYRNYDIFVVHNVWLSKAFDFAPRGTLRLLDSHDVFSTRMAYFDASKGAPEFFLTDANSEAHGASRADIVLGIQDNDASWFARHTRIKSLCLPYDGGIAPTGRLPRKDYLHNDKVVFGFLGSAHIFNIRGLAAYCDELTRLVGRSAAPVELRLGGNVCRSIESPGPWILCGKVEDEDEFFDEVDIVVAPVFEGSGFKVKVADAVARGLPVITASHAAIGMSFDKRAVANNALELARMSAHIALHRPLYRTLYDISREANLDLVARTSRAVRKLSRIINSWPCSILYDLTGLTTEQASCVLLSWSGAFHLMRFLAKQLVIAPAALHHLEGVAPAGVFFISEEEAHQYAKGVWRWITVRNLNPASWGADPLEIWSDPTWDGVFNDTPDDDQSIPFVECQDKAFWHNLTWDSMVQEIIKKAAESPARRGQRRQETVIITNRRHYGILHARITGLFPTLRVAIVDQFADFYNLVIRVSSGDLRRLVVLDGGFRPRIRILRQLCAVRGIEFIGLVDGGIWSAGRAPEDSVKRMYERFENQWRFKRGEIAFARGHGRTVEEVQ